MNIIQRLFIKYWFVFFLSFFIGLNIISFAGDFLNSLLRSQEDIQEIIINYYYGLPMMLEKIIPVTALLASVFTINKLKQTSELTAILAIGYSKVAMIKLFIFLGLLVSLSQLINLGFFAPSLLEKQIATFDQTTSKTSKRTTTQAIETQKQWIKSEGYFLSYTYFDEEKLVLWNPRIYFYDEQSYLLRRALEANKARFNSQTGQWVMEDLSYYQDLDGKNFPQLKTMNDEAILINEMPEDFSRYQSNILTLNIFELQRFLIRIRLTGVNLTEQFSDLYNNFALIFSCILFTLLPVALTHSSNRRGGGQGSLFGYGFLFFIGFWILQGFALTLTKQTFLPYTIGPFVTPFSVVIYLLITFYKQEKNLS